MCIQDFFNTNNYGADDFLHKLLSFIKFTKNSATHIDSDLPENKKKKKYKK